jgi:hypothetical protein
MISGGDVRMTAEDISGDSSKDVQVIVRVLPSAVSLPQVRLFSAANPCLQLLEAACQQEVATVIQLATTYPYCTLQFAAHIYDVLRASPGAERVISRPAPNFGGDQCEMFTLHYVDTLVGQAATWQIAAEYLAWCPVHGSAVLEGLLERSPVSALCISTDSIKQICV